MQRFIHLLTSLTFAAHALLGCGVHSACPAAPAPAEHVRHSCSQQHGLCEHHENAQAPADSQLPAHHGPHLACSFVKAETVRIDCGDLAAQPVASLAPAARINATNVGRGDCETICKSASPPGRLYVWHCALLI